MGESVTTFVYTYEPQFHKDDLVFVTATLVTVNDFWSNDFTVDSNLRHVYKLLEIGLFNKG